MVAGAAGGGAGLRAQPFVRAAAAPAFGARIAAGAAASTTIRASSQVAIGSGRWWRGLAGCASLSTLALMLAPGLEPIAGAATPVADGATGRLARAVAIAPLGQGGRSGLRVAPGDAVRPLDHVPERPRIALTATIPAGDRLDRVLLRAGVAAAEAGRAAALVSPLVAPDRIASGTPVEVVLGRRLSPAMPRPVERIAFRARFDMRVAIVRAGGGLALQAMPIAVDATPLRIQGVAGTGLYRAARTAGVPARAIQDYLRALSSQIDVGSIGAGDRFDLIVEHRRIAGGESESGRLLYAGLMRSAGAPIQLLEWQGGDGERRWVDATGAAEAASGGALQRPVPGTVSSAFGWRRHPILGFSRLHKGIDFRAGYGTPILAATDGQVVRAGWAGGYGKQVRLAHGAGYATSYSHMSRILAQPGEMVRQGQVIGYVGSTGLSTGPHLHYEFMKDGVAIDPASVAFISRAAVAGPELQLLRERLARLLRTPVGAARS